MFQIKERQLGRMKNSYLTKIFFSDYRVVGSISLLNGYLFPSLCENNKVLQYMIC